MMASIFFSSLVAACLCLSVLHDIEGIEQQNIPPSKLEGAEFIQLKNGYRVWTQRVGKGPIKILTLHGGPGCSHEYLECLADFFPGDKYQVIFYDQLGSYYSDQPDDPSLWTVSRFCDEVEEVRIGLGLEDFYLYGQSWGGMLAIEYAINYPKHLRGVIFSNITGSVDSYVTYLSHLRSQLPQVVQDKLKYYEDKEDYENPEYEKLLFKQLYNKHVCLVDPWPQAFVLAFAHINKQVYLTMQGPNEFIVNGNFRNWNRWNDLHTIKTPSLFICGRHDTMSPEDNIRMGQLVPNATVKICENGSHGALYDDQENYFQALHDFIDSVEGKH
ncbi:MAG: proline iminopeptidase-family hydrolase [Parachlamydiales bacterium]|jgi:proline iminopeptidase